MRIRSLMAAALLAAAPDLSAAQYDPYGRWNRSGPAVERPVRGSRLLKVEDGTPIHELAPNAYTSPAVESRMLSIIEGSNLPVGAGPQSPFLPGTDLRFEHHYLIDFWKTYPQAKVRGGERTAPSGYVPPALPRSAMADMGGVPAAAAEVLFAQAAALYGEVIKIPMIQRSQGVLVRPTLRLRRRTDAAGTEVYGFTLNVSVPPLDTSKPDGRGVDGRWRSAAGGHTAGLMICSNCPVDYGPAWGRYGRTQVAFLNPLAALVVSNTRPTHISEFKGGGGKMLPNPAFYDPARPKTDIQVLTAMPRADSPLTGRWAGQGSLPPDFPYARMIAASFIPDWRSVVDRLNGPGAPPAQ